MSEFWVSRKKYYCKYCDIFIADDAPSRQMHEGGMRHIGNKERALRDIYKNGETKKKEAEEEKREMARIEQAAAEAHARDTGEPIASSSKQPTAKTAAAKPAGKFDSYTTAADLGFVDPDEEIKAQAELRKTEGTAGDWQEVVVPPPPAPDFAKRPVEQEDEIRDFKFARKERKIAKGSLFGGDDDFPEIKVKVQEKSIGHLEPKQETAPLVWKSLKWGEKKSASRDASQTLPIAEESLKSPNAKSPDPTSEPLTTTKTTAETEDVKVPESEEDETKPAVIEAVVAKEGGSLFKKRRGAPSNAQPMDKKPKRGY